MVQAHRINLGFSLNQKVLHHYCNTFVIQLCRISIFPVHIQILYNVYVYNKCILSRDFVIRLFDFDCY